MATGHTVSQNSVYPRLLLRTLGPLELFVHPEGEEEHLVPAAGKALALLAYLACAPTRSAYRERLTELLWATSSTESGLQSLRQVRLTLRRLVGAEVVTSDGEALALAPSVRVDRDDFLGHLAAKRLDEAIRLHRGPFCDRFAAAGAEDFERWVGAERTSLQSHAVEALDRLATVALNEARVGDALALATRLREADGDDERHWRIRLEALLLKHDHFGAAIAAKECRAWLEAEQREPSRSLRMLVERASAARRGGESDTTQVGDVPGLHADLTGRERQFAALLAAWRESHAGRGNSVVLIGASGHGKTRLLRDVQERIAATRGRASAIRALSADSGVRFALVSRLAAALAGMRGAAGLSRTSATVLLALNPSLSSSFPSAHAATLGADPVLPYLEALDELLRVLADESPLAVFIDDLQLSDPDSARILASLGDRQTARRVMFVLAVRSRATAAPPLPSSAVQVRVEPLSADETDGLLASIARLPAGDGYEWRTELHRASGGSPLLILETLRLAMDAGSISIEQGGWVLTDATGFKAMLDQRTVLADRLSRLDPEALRVATTLAVAGRPLSEDALADETRAAGEDASAALLRLEVRDVVARTPEGWVIAHDALAETLETTVGLEALDTAKLRAALVLRRTGDPESGIRAMHLFAGIGRWAECAEAVARIATVLKTSRQTGYAAARGVLAQIDPEPARQQVRRRLPTHLRFPVGAIAVTGALILAAATGLVLIEARAQADARTPDERLVVYGTADNGTAVSRQIEVSETGWSTARPIDMRLGRAASRRVPPGPRPELINPLNGASAVERFYADSGRTDVALSFPDGREERLTDSPGDDVPADWAPDYSTLLIESARGGARGHRAIWAIDISRHSVRRVTSGGSRGESDGTARWSPDGSRIAFVRRYFDIRPSEFCTVDSDSRFEQCRVLVGRSVRDLGGWIDHEHVLVMTDSADVGHTESVRVSTGAIAAVSGIGANCTVSPEGRWLACSSPPDGARTIAPITSPARARLVLMDGVQAPAIGWLRSVGGTSVAHRIEVRSPVEIAPVGVGTLLQAKVFNRTGDPLDGIALRWSTHDTTLATVSSSGLLVPKRVGSVRVQASAGGWRTADVVVRAGTSPATELLREEWGGAVEDRWTFFGHPRPMIVDADGRRAFWNRGDGEHFSGAYSRTGFSVKDGLWVEAELSTRVTATQWQTTMLMIRRTGDDRVLQSWDHSGGPFPPSGKGAYVCYFQYPEGEGFGALNQISGVGDISSALGFPISRLREGGWYRVLLQLLPDGRCGVAINGVPIIVRMPVSFGADSVVLQLEGSSVDTRILVGPLVTGRGVRTDIDWARLDRRPER